MLHPRGRVSEVQRRQMTTVLAPNVYNIALEGTFDDCQDQVKAMFNDLAFRDAMNLSAVNSINWARIMAQIVYYFAAGVALGAPDRAVAFAVPTGNFGNVFSAYAAGRMGLPVAQLVVGSRALVVVGVAVAAGGSAAVGFGLRAQPGSTFTHSAEARMPAGESTRRPFTYMYDPMTYGLRRSSRTHSAPPIESSPPRRIAAVAIRPKRLPRKVTSASTPNTVPKK